MRKYVAIQRLAAFLTGDLVYCQQVAHKIGSLTTLQSPSGLYAAGRGKRADISNIKMAKALVRNATVIKTVT